MHNVGPDPNTVADEIKKNADLVMIAFGNDADEKMLKRLASTTKHFYRCSSGRELRSFMAAVGATLTQTMTVGQNTTNALAAL
jgi:hypothetical protein